MKKNLLALALLFSTQVSNAQNFNITLAGIRTYPGDDLSNIGGWVSPGGVEYALVGTEAGLSIVDVSTPSNPVEKILVPGPRSIWREVKTYDHYAYVTTEGGGGLQIVDLSQLPTAAPAILWTGNGIISGQLDNIHSLHIEDGYVYLHGSNLFNGAAIIADIATNPLSPNYVGHTPGGYVHDGYARGNYYYGCHVYVGDFTIYDVTNKANPIPLGQQITPAAFTHNCWLSTNSQYLFTTDETSNSYLTSYDVTNPTNITEMDRIQITPGSGSIVHNTHIIEKNGADYAVTSWYKDGVVITDVTRPQNMVNVGRYDTYAQGAGNGFNGDWGVYPYLPSGILVVSDINNGLFVLNPTYTRACYLEGIVTDSISGLPLNNATVQILTTSISKNTKNTGEYKTGTPTAGTYNIQVSRSGYITKTIYNVVLSPGVVTQEDVQLVPVGQAIALNGQVVETGTGAPIANAQISFSNSGFNYTATADATGSFNIPSFFTGTYDIVAGSWGHRTYCFNTAVNAASNPLIISLDKGYYDDFSFDFGWTVSGTSPNAWERGAPVGTPAVNGPGYSNPNVDVSTDCLDQAYVTDNNPNATTAGSNDVDNGNTVLTSPLFDPTYLVSPTLKYYRWFYNAGGSGNPNDTLTVKIDNGITRVTLETVLASTPGMGSWVSRTYNLSNSIAITTTMQVIVETADQPLTGHVVEGGFDQFEITEGTVGLPSISENQVFLSSYPNPFNNGFTLRFKVANASNASLLITDLAGRKVEQQLLNSTSGTLVLGENLSNGIYLIHLQEGGNTLKSLKVVKAKL